MSSASSQDTKPPQDFAINFDELWRVFLTTDNSGDYCQAWLALLCRQLSGVVAALVLLEAEQGDAFVPMAAWPVGRYDQQYLGETAQKALSERKGVIDRQANPPGQSRQIRAYIAYPIEVAAQLKGAVVLDVAVGSDEELTAKLRQLHWGIAWLMELFYRQNQGMALGRAERVTGVMETVATVLRHQELQAALFALVNELADRFHCDRVAIGLEKNRHIELKAISRSAWFEKNSSLVRQLAAAMDEAGDRYQTIRLAEGRAPGFPAHQALLQETAATAVLSVPLGRAGNCQSVLLMERSEAGAFTDAETLWVESLAALLAPLLLLQGLADRSLWRHFRDLLGKLGEKLFGHGHLSWKAAGAACAVTVLILGVVETEYRVAAKTVIEGEVQRIAAAPFEGFVADSQARAGEIVMAGQTLCVLDDKDLLLERAKYSGELQQYIGKLREAMANRDLSATQIVTAQMNQAQAQLDLVEQKLVRTRVRAPFDGVVVSGDLSQLIGSPVEQGKKLFEIAPLNSYRVIIQVDEREIADIRQNQGGRLMISGIPGDPLEFSVKQVTPVATALDGRNFFRVEAQLKTASERLRPGMEGVGKIDAGRRRLIWIYTHSFMDWLRLSFWTWIP